MAKWFTLADERVEGPFSTDELKQKVQLGSLSKDSLVWGQAQKDWKTISWWQSNLDELLSKLQNNFDDRLWHYALKGQSYGPMSRKQLIAELKKMTGDANDSLIWTKGMENWAPIHEFHDLMDEVGVNRRIFPRAPVSGKVVINITESQTLIGTLATISEGGFGAEKLSGLVPGDQVSVELQPEGLAPIHATAQIRYTNERQFVGFKFTKINRESLSRVITFVKNSVEEQISSMKSAS